MNTLKAIYYNFTAQYFWETTILQLQWTSQLLPFYLKIVKKTLKNWRPIFLLCSGNKMLSKILSNRLKPTLQHAISIEQTCGIPNRSIFSNLFTIREIINHSNTKNINSFIISVDQEKAFDKVDREFLYQIMRKLGYSEIFIKFIKKLYQNTLSIISNNGFLLPPSPYLDE